MAQDHGRWRGGNTAETAFQRHVAGMREQEDEGFLELLGEHPKIIVFRFPASFRNLTDFVAAFICASFSSA